MFVNLFNDYRNIFCSNEECKKSKKRIRHLQHYDKQIYSNGVIVNPSEVKCDLYIKGVKNKKGV